MYCNLSFGAFVKLTLQSKFKYRDRISIVTDILDAVSDDPQGKTKTGIMRSANLNFDQANKYLHLLILCDLLKAKDPLESYEVARYRLTGKGLEIARHLTALQFALEPLLKKPI
jgi:predicted transcriptional regulator